MKIVTGTKKGVVVMNEHLLLGIIIHHIGNIWLSICEIGGSWCAWLRSKALTGR